MSRDTESSKMLFYEQFADHFDEVVNMYDTRKRLAVIFEEFLPQDLRGLQVLDGGCGTGWQSQQAAARGAKVTSLDMGPELLKQVAKKCRTKRVVGSILKLPFKAQTFDIVVSSEVIEHVTDPHKAIREFYRVLKPGGVMALTTPNAIWHFAVTIGNALHARPYQGLENWLSWSDLRQSCEEVGFVVQKQRGIHLFPFVTTWSYPILDFWHYAGYWLGSIMLNQAILVQKPGLPSKRKAVTTRKKR